VSKVAMSQVMREIFFSKIASMGLSSQSWARFMIKMRQDFGEMTRCSVYLALNFSCTFAQDNLSHVNPDQFCHPGA
jgi:hypothetical protein